MKCNVYFTPKEIKQMKYMQLNILQHNVGKAKQIKHKIIFEF